MPSKNTAQECVLVIIAEGFDEQETVVMVSIFRQAGLCVKTVALASGLVGGVHGIHVMPDLTLFDLNGSAKAISFSVVVLPENKQCLAKLESDPRLHNFLSQVRAQKRQIAVGYQGRQFLRKISLLNPGTATSDARSQPSLLLQQPGQSIEAYARDIVQKLGRTVRA